MNSDDQKHMASNTANTITEEKIMERVISEEYVHMGVKTTICLLTLKNGFEIVGTSGCADPKNFDFEKGRYWAKKDAIGKIWAFEGYLLAEKLALGI